MAAVGDTEKTTPAGRYLTRRMNELGFKTKADLADRAGVSRSTITRLFSNADYRPDIHNMRRLAGALEVDPEVLVAAIYGEAAPAEPAAIHPLAAELGRMLAEDSPLSVSTRALQEVLVDQVMEGGRREMRGGQPPQSLRVGEAVISKLASGRVQVEPAGPSGEEPGPDPETFRLSRAADRVARLLDPDGPLDAKTRKTLSAAISNICDLIEKPPSAAQRLRDEEALEVFAETVAALEQRREDAGRESGPRARGGR
ncbi:helix-turn-helix transcriptional regulator [Dactylosporangium sp. NPDC000244]|uniref:helix-turn-helix domain-containing protein n=1 Tax=Dactylosporangium sp. NPDC000244 TaxID=3154365 RepID=UPI00331AB668